MNPPTEDPEQFERGFQQWLWNGCPYAIDPDKRIDAYHRWLGVVCTTIDHAPGQTIIRGQPYRLGQHFAVCITPQQPLPPPRQRLAELFRPSPFSPFLNPAALPMMTLLDGLTLKLRISEEFRIPPSQKKHFEERLQTLAHGFKDLDDWSQALEITSMVPSEASEDIILRPEAWLARMKTIRATAIGFTQSLLPELRDHPPELWIRFCIETALDWTHRTPAVNKLTSSALRNHLLKHWETRLAVEQHLRKDREPSAFERLSQIEPKLATEAGWQELIAELYPYARKLAGFSPYYSNIPSSPFDLIHDAILAHVGSGLVDHPDVRYALKTRLAFAIHNVARKRRRRVEHKRRRMIGSENDLSNVPNAGNPPGAPDPLLCLKDFLPVPEVRQKLQKIAPEVLPVFEVLLLQDAGDGRKHFSNAEGARRLGYTSDKSFYNARHRLIKVLRDLDYLPQG